MPRISLTRDELTLIRDLLVNGLIGLDDDRSVAEDDGDTEAAEELRRAWERMDALVDKVVKARG